MEDLLFLPQRCPYPPNKGDKIATWHILKFLLARYNVHLGTFIDDPADWHHADFLRSKCASVHLEGLTPRTAKIKSLRGFLTGEALSVAYYRHPGMQNWVNQRLAGGVKRVFVFSSAIAQFVTQAQGCTRIMDFCDLDSDKWRQYAQTCSWPMSWVYAREAKKLLEWERKIAHTFDRSLFISAAEAADFKALAPESASKVDVLSNGVDADYFSPAKQYDTPFTSQPQLVFTGAMDYRPNIDAVVWFAHEAFPHIRRQQPNAGFCIVGSKPAAEVQALVALPGITVTGRVEDVRPYLAHAACVVAPLRIARGIQNKVLEGMAMAKPVVCSPQALEGIEAKEGKEVHMADTPRAFAAACLQVMRGEVEMGQAARARVLETYDWGARLARLDQFLA